MEAEFCYCQHSRKFKKSSERLKKRSDWETQQGLCLQPQWCKNAPYTPSKEDLVSGWWFSAIFSNSSKLLSCTPSDLAPATQPLLRCRWRCPSLVPLAPHTLLQLSKCEKSSSARLDHQLPISQSFLGELQEFEKHPMSGSMVMSISTAWRSPSCYWE